MGEETECKVINVIEKVTKLHNKRGSREEPDGAPLVVSMNIQIVLLKEFS